MKRRAQVAVLGAGGSVGRAAVRSLGKLFMGPLRLGSRDQAELTRLLKDEPLGAGDHISEVEIYDAASLAAFCDGSDVVLNCAGPSLRIGDRVARAALTAGAHYVDVSGDDPVVESLLADPCGAETARAAVVSAGMLPGLTGILPRWLAAQAFDEVTGMRVHVGGLERCTFAAGADILLNLGGGFGRPLGAWRDGGPVSGAIPLCLNDRVPCFPERASTHPFLSTEAERVATTLGLRWLDWFNVMVGIHTRTVLGRLRHKNWHEASGGELEGAVDELVRAAGLDMAGRDAYQILVFEARGRASGCQLTRTAVLRASDSYQLTGAVGAIAVRALLEGKVSPSAHFAAEVLEPDVVLTVLRSLEVIRSLEIVDGSAEEAARLEEGVL